MIAIIICVCVFVSFLFVVISVLNLIVGNWNVRQIMRVNRGLDMEQQPRWMARWNKIIGCD